MPTEMGENIFMIHWLKKHQLLFPSSFEVSSCRTRALCPPNRLKTQQDSPKTLRCSRSNKLRQEYIKDKLDHKAFQLLTHRLDRIDPVLMRYRPSNDHCWIVLQYEDQAFDPAVVPLAFAVHGYSSSPPRSEHHLPTDHTKQAVFKDHVYDSHKKHVILEVPCKFLSAKLILKNYNFFL